MTKRLLTIEIEAESVTCGDCKYMVESASGILGSVVYCGVFHEHMGIITEADMHADAMRLQRCLDAEGVRERKR
jgi:hypothetical protein